MKKLIVFLSTGFLLLAFGGNLHAGFLDLFKKPKASPVTRTSQPALKFAPSREVQGLQPAVTAAPLSPAPYPMVPATPTALPCTLHVADPPGLLRPSGVFESITTTYAVSPDDPIVRRPLDPTPSDATSYPRPVFVRFDYDFQYCEGKSLILSYIPNFKDAPEMSTWKYTLTSPEGYIVIMWPNNHSLSDTTTHEAMVFKAVEPACPPGDDDVCSEVIIASHEFYFGYVVDTAMPDNKPPLVIPF